MSSCSNAKTGFSFSSSIVAADNLIINAIFKVPRSVRMMFIYPRILTFSIILIFFLLDHINCLLFSFVISTIVDYFSLQLIN